MDENAWTLGLSILKTPPQELPTELTINFILKFEEESPGVMKARLSNLLSPLLLKGMDELPEEKWLELIKQITQTFPPFTISMIFSDGHLIEKLCSLDDPRLLETILELHPPLCRMTVKGGTLLHLACHKRNESLVSFLMKKYPWMLIKTDQAFNTPLLLCIELQELKLVSLLLSREALMQLNHHRFGSKSFHESVQQEIERKAATSQIHEEVVKIIKGQLKFLFQ